MHKKYNTQNFVQGLRPFINSLPQGIKKNLRKRGYNFSNIVDNWSKIVGKDISNCCYPIKIKVGKTLSGGILILNVVHGKELEVEYGKKKIIDKINSFFGYNYVEKIILNLIQDKKEKLKISGSTNSTNKDFKGVINKISNLDLKKLIDKLVKAYNGKNNF